jgi:hypothetical protein
MKIRGTISAIFVAIVLVGCLGLLGMLVHDLRPLWMNTHDTHDTGYTASILLRMRGAVGVAGTQSAARLMLTRLVRVGLFTMAIAVAIGCVRPVAPSASLISRIFVQNQCRVHVAQQWPIFDGRRACVLCVRLLFRCPSRSD